MAVQVMAEVWEHSQAAGTRLLILLAMADRARKEDAVCWPGVASIAQQARVSERDVRHHLVSLQEMGELCLVRRGGQGPKDTSVYQVSVGRYKGASAISLRGDAKAETGFTEKGVPIDTLKGAKRANKGAKDPQIRVKPASADPLVLDPLVDPLEPKEPSAGVSPTDVEAPPGSMVLTDGLDAGTLLVEDPSTGRLRLAGGARRSRSA